MSYKIIGSTMGQSTPATVAEEAGSYHWRGNPDWYPGNPAYREVGNAANKMSAGSAGVVNAKRRQERLKEFADALAELGHPDPVQAPNPAVIKAGAQIGVGEKTAKSYRTEIKQQRQREQSGETCDA